MVHTKISEKIDAYLGVMDEHHRYRSWEHCYRYFQKTAQTGLSADRDQAALQLGFYLASWGMYRGSSFLLSRAYTVHLGVIDLLETPRFSSLWNTEFGANDAGEGLVSDVLALIEGIRAAYQPFGEPTDTLITKVALGTCGCLPACDRYFLYGFKSAGHSYSYLNRNFIDRILRFCREHRQELQAAQSRIKTTTDVTYPLMKLADMYFWQLGFEQGAPGEDA